MHYKTNFQIIEILTKVLPRAKFKFYTRRLEVAALVMDELKFVPQMLDISLTFVVSVYNFKIGLSSYK